ncbi:uncharacterized protein LOC107733624 [Sinocyclocheilus rhinocerous]|uniref:uncharacterized protein LOC107733624 n=1 Tax=Sinocyclocheilus rhinocerous TaxID=307959 RepID=UPI0007BA611B|nr:PREDICTED: uncharacterized protein LOC107733624 [Sinocyclocheilus rhinocerous]
MPLTPIKIFILMCGFCSQLHAIAYPPVQTVQTQNEVSHSSNTPSLKVVRGSDVSLRCDFPLLNESSTLHWEKDGEQISNATLMYNNSAYIILHTVDERSEETYYCKLMEDGRVETVRIHTLNVTSHSHNGKNKNRLIYRQSSSNSDVLLICKSSRKYDSLKWTWEPRPNSQIDLIAFEKERQVQLKGPIKPGRCSSATYNSQALIFHISPVNFNYRGTYRCITDTGIYTTIILHTIRVSVEPPDGVLRNQSVVLTCELSEVTGSVILVWLRMEGNRGVLVKQQIMTEKNKKLQLTVNLSSYETDPMNWQCAVFTENTLRALAPETQLNIFLRGSDVSLRCDFPLLNESSTLHWEKDGEQISNATLMYNNSAYIILHTVDERSEETYYCKLMEDGRVETVRIHTHRKNKNHTIYRQSSSNSDVLLICKSSRKYDSLKWTWEPRPNSQIDLIAFEKERQVQLKGPIKPGRCSSATYNSQALIFHISPVNFNYRGTYRCITDTGIYTTIILHTIRVSVEPPDGVLRNQSVVLTCELSEVTGSVMLVWLRMEGNRGVLVKQQIMTEKNKKLQLTVNLSSYETDPMNWQCAVFTENTLRALAPITISLTSTTTNAPSMSTETSTVTNQAINKHAKATASCVLALFTGILLGALLCYCYRKRMSVHSDPQESEPVYINISQMRNDRVDRSSTLENRENSPEIYRNIRRNRYGKTNINKRDETTVTSDSVTYATIYFNKSRFQT